MRAVYSCVLSSLLILGCGDDGPVDTTAPETQLDSTPPALTNLRHAAFSFSATGTVTEFLCKLDSNAPQRCMSPHDVEISDGTHVFTVAGSNNGSVDETPASYSWVVDSAPPDTSIASGPPSFDNSTTATIVFGGAPAEDIAKFECSLDGAPFATCTSPNTLTDLTPGLKNFQVRAVDAAGNFDGSPAQRSWNLDTSTPDTAITSGPAEAATSGGNVTFMFDSPLTTSVFECAFDGGSFTGCSSPISYTSLPTGAHTFMVRARNPSIPTAVDPTPASRAWTVDATPPAVTIDTRPADPTNDTTPDFTFSSPATDLAGFECQFDGTTTFTACTSPVIGATSLDGAQTFHVRATDLYGNQSTTSYTWTVDTVAPTVTITSGPSGTIGTNSTSFAFTTGGAPTSIQCRRDALPFATCTSPTSLTGLSDGPHTFDLLVTDSAGNTGTASRMFSVSTVGPTVTITGGPTGPTNVNPPTFTFTTTNASTIDCRMDGGTYASCTSPFTPSALSQGIHTFEVRVRDAALTTTTASRTFTIDTVTPTVAIQSGPSGPTNDSTPTFAFLVTGSPTSTECRFDAAAFAACTSPTTASPALAEGAHTFDVRVTDAAGNTSSDTRSFSVVLTGPTVTITSGPSGATNDDTANFTFTTTGSPSVVECKLDVGAFAPCASPFVSDSLADGSHTFTVQVRDAALNQSSDSRTFTVDTISPAVAITSGPSGPSNDSTPTFAFTANGASTISCRFDAAAFAACTSPFTPGTALGDGAHVFEVQVADAAGNTANDTRAFSLDTDGVTVTITGGPIDPTPTTDNTPTFTFTTTGSPTTTECKIDAGSFGACGPTTFTPSPLGGGAHVFTIRVADIAGNTDTKTRNFTVDSTAPGVTVATGPNGACGSATCNPSNDATPTFTFAVTSGWTTLRCHFDGAAAVDCSAGITAGAAGTGTFTAGAALAAGNHTFEVEACNASLNCSSDLEAFSVDIIAPTLSITAGPTGGCATPATCSISNDATPTFAYSSSGGGVAFECNVNPGAVAGTTFSACSSTAFTSPSITDGPYTFTVRVRDAAFNFTTASRTFTTDTASPVVSITTPAADGSIRNAAFGIVYSIVDSTATTQTCTLKSPSNVTVTLPSCTTTGVNSGTLTEQGTYTFTLAVTDSASNAATTVVRTFVRDTVSPVVSITNPASDGTIMNGSFLTFAYTIADTTATTQSCTLRAPSNATTTLTPCNTTTANSGTLTEQGTYTFTVVVTDSAGNPATTTMRTFVRDTIPSIVAITNPSSDNQIRNTGFNVTYTIVDITATTQACTLKSPSNVTTTLTPCNGTTANTGTLTEQGTYTFTLIATDAAGNPSSTAVRTFIRDTESPVVVITSPPVGATQTNASAITFNYTITDTTATTQTCTLTAPNMTTSTLTPCTATSATSGSLTQQGTYTFTLVVTDGAGNPATTQTRSFLRDSQPPTVSITSPAANGTINNGPLTFTYDINDATPTTQACSMTSPSSVVTSLSPCNATTANSGTLTEQGTYTFAVVVTDSAGNAAASATRTFIRDTVSPVVAITSPAADGTLLNTSSVAFTYTITDGTSTTQTCTLTPPTGGPVTLGSCTATGVSTGPLTQQGTYSFALVATDAAGNPATTATRTFVRDSQSPVVVITNPAANGTVTNAASIAFTYTITDASTTTQTCTLTPPTGAPVTLSPCTATGVNSGTLTQQGLYSFTVAATDAAGNPVTSVARTFTRDSQPPTVAITTPATDGTVHNTAFNIVYSITDGSTTTRTCTLTSPTSVVTNPTPCNATTAGTGTLTEEGTYTFSLVVTDSGGNPATTVTRTFLRDVTSPVVAITTPAANGTFQNTAFSFAWTITDATATTQTCTLTPPTGAPVTLSPCTTTGVASGALNQEGTYSLALVVTDGASNPATTVTRTFLRDVTAPVIAFTDCPAAADDDGDVVITFTNDDTATATCTLDTASVPCPANTYTSAALADGTYELIASATDAAGNTGSDTCSFDVMMVTMIAVGPSGPTNDATPTFTLWPDALVNAPECRIDGGAFAACPTGSFTALPLADGMHTFELRTTENGKATYETRTFDVNPVAVCLDGRDQIQDANVSRTLSGLDRATIDVWFRSATTVDDFVLLELEPPPLDPVRPYIELGFANGAFELVVDPRFVMFAKSARSVRAFTPPAGFAPDVWHHYAVVFAGDAQRLYVDGVELVARQVEGTSGASFKTAFGERTDDVILSLGHIPGLKRSAPGAFLDLRVSSAARYTSTFVPAYPHADDARTVLLYPLDEGAGEESFPEAQGDVLRWSAPATWSTCTKAVGATPPLAPAAILDNHALAKP